MFDSQLEKTLLTAVKQQLHNGRPILARFQHYYHALCSLPRRTRRLLRRKLAMSLAAAALLLALSGSPAPPAIQAATISGSPPITQVQSRRDAPNHPAGVRPPTQSTNQPAVSFTAINPITQLPNYPITSGVLYRQSPAVSFTVNHPLLKYPAALQPGSPGATITVNGNNPGTDCTLDNAIIAANTDAAAGNCNAGSGDDILDIQVNVNLTAPAPAIATSISLEGNGNTIAGDNTFGPLLTVTATGDMTLNDATLSGGNNAATYGGGLLVDGGTAEINNSTISGNTTSSGGGGAANLYGSLTVNDSLVTNNNADSGGGLQNVGGTITVTNSAVSDNMATYGGGIRNQQTGDLFIIDSTISGNQATAGGAIANPGFSGTAISYVRIDNSAISGNTATQYSAGIDNIGGSILVVNNSTLSGNSNAGSYGGAIYSGFNASTSLTITDSTITGNSVNGSGAGVWMQNGQGTIGRSLISGNSGASYADDVYNSDALTVDSYNLFGHNGLTTIQSIAGFTPGPSDIVATSDGTVPTPLTDILNPTLQDNNGSTQTHALTLASPALDGVADGSCAAGDEDQRHFPRGMGAGMGGPLCDIGAFELQNTSPTDVSLTGFAGESDGRLIPAFLTTLLASLATLAAALHLRKPKKDYET
jgi:hypothetical protein